MLLIWRFQIKWIHVIILEKCSYVHYFYIQINNNQMQRELFNNMFRSTLHSVSVTTGPLRDADVAHSENEFDTPDLQSPFW